MEIKVLEPIGFCSGVKRAIKAVYKAKKDFPDKKIIILGQLIHNEETLEQLKNDSVFIMEGDLNNEFDILNIFERDDVIFILSAHGHSEKLVNFLTDNNFNFIDATCPIIKKINNDLKKTNFKDTEVFYYGKKDHAECKASLSYIKNYKSLEIIDPKININNLIYQKEKSYLVNQSTVPLFEIKKFAENKKTELIIKDNFCPSLKQRFEKIDENINNFDTFIVIGDKESSNANQLYNYIKEKFKRVFLVQKISDFLYIDFPKESQKVAVLSATSTSESKVNDFVNYLNENR